MEDLTVAPLLNTTITPVPRKQLMLKMEKFIWEDKSMLSSLATNHNLMGLLQPHQEKATACFLVTSDSTPPRILLEDSLDKLVTLLK